MNNTFRLFTKACIILHIILYMINCTSMAQSYLITITAGDYDRTESIVSFNFPEKVEPGVYKIHNDEGEYIDLQVTSQNRGWFILKDLQAGKTQTFQFDHEKKQIEPAVSISKNSNKVTFYVNGNDLISYYYKDNTPPEELGDRYKRGGYLHPVRSPNGVVLTNHLNINNHPHHSGIWSAWTKTSFLGRSPDFWNLHENTGRVVQQDTLDDLWEGPVNGGFRTKHYFIDLSVSVPVVAINEKWEVRVYPSLGGRKIRVFDLKVTQTSNTAQTLILPEYRYGGVGFRGHEDWDNPDNVTFLTNNGHGRDGHGTRVRWTHIGGKSNGKLAGISILSHPENFRHPQPVRIHPDAPFFNFAPVQLGDMKIEPGSPYVAQYRFITYDGEPDPKFIDKMWYDYAYPVGVTVTKL